MIVSMREVVNKGALMHLLNMFSSKLYIQAQINCQSQSMQI